MKKITIKFKDNLGHYYNIEDIKGKKNQKLLEIIDDDMKKLLLNSSVSKTTNEIIYDGDSKKDNQFSIELNNTIHTVAFYDSNFTGSYFVLDGDFTNGKLTLPQAMEKGIYKAYLLHKAQSISNICNQTTSYQELKNTYSKISKLSMVELINLISLYPASLEDNLFNGDIELFADLQNKQNTSLQEKQDDYNTRLNKRINFPKIKGIIVNDVVYLPYSTIFNLYLTDDILTSGRYIKLCKNDEELTDCVTNNKFNLGKRLLLEGIPLCTMDGLSFNTDKFVMAYQFNNVNATNITRPQTLTDNDYVIDIKGETMLGNASNIKISFLNMVKTYLKLTIDIDINEALNGMMYGNIKPRNAEHIMNIIKYNMYENSSGVMKVYDSKITKFSDTRYKYLLTHKEEW